ncbi:MAG TPA: hypothetical protein VFV93_02150 [Thermomicrobiales bacterium]|nr:hypothetical protein [Thermomicrobiales bacterium]
MAGPRRATRCYRVAVVLSLLLLPLTVAGVAAAKPNGDSPGQAKQAEAGSWVGKLRGDSALVAIVYDGAQLVAYVCDDGRVGSWFFAAPGPGSSFQLAGAGDSLLEVTLGSVAKGQYSKDGQVYEFNAHKSKDEVLFRADTAPNDIAVVGGWIQDGGQTRGTVAIGSSLIAAPKLAPTVKITLSPDVLATLSPAAMTPDTLSRAIANTTKFVWAAAGDSYASGEGNPERGISDPDDPEDFSGLRWGNDPSITIPIPGVSLGADLTTCHRSDEAAAPKAQRFLEDTYTGMTIRLGFVACGGAETGALTGTYDGPDTSEESLLGYDRVNEQAQLDRIAGFATDEGELNALYMSIGGNNAGFGEIITDCVSPFGPSNCADVWDTVLDARLFNLVKPGGEYEQVNDAIVERFGDDLPVLIQAYPNPLDDGSTGIPPVCFGTDYDAHGEVGFGGYDDALQDNVTHEEADWAYDVPDKLNSAVESAAGTYGWTVVDGHLAAFKGHGICTAEPFDNLNSAGLHRQGRDIPNTGPFLFSSGLMHPNDDGYTQIAQAAIDDLRPLVDNVARADLVKPLNVRVADATKNGSITLRWNDRSKSENAYEVLVLPVRPQDGGVLIRPAGSTPFGAGYRIRLSGSDLQQYIAQFAGGGQFSFQVRACQTGIRFVEGAGAELQCGEWSAPLIGTNVAPATPTAVQHSTQTVRTGTRFMIVDVVTWSPQADAIEFVVRIETPDGSASETRTTGTRFQRSVLAGATYKVAACNRIGCSFYVTAP